MVEHEGGTVDPRVARTRAAILTAGRALLAEGGLAAVTHLHVADRAGVGRRSVYRHWPSRDDLLHDVLSSASAPTWRPTDDLAVDVLAHLRELRDALVHGPLALVVAALAERSAVDASYVPLRDRLVESGCAPLRNRLQVAVTHGVLPAEADLDGMLARLEGPLFYEVLVRGRAPDDALLDQVLDQVVPSLRTTRPRCSRAVHEPERA
jgi:AcrR family transcriptional regulator